MSKLDSSLESLHVPQGNERLVTCITYEDILCLHTPGLSVHFETPRDSQIAIGHKEKFKFFPPYGHLLSCRLLGEVQTFYPQRPPLPS